jgi:hypothetical protein
LAGLKNFLAAARPLLAGARSELKPRLTDHSGFAAAITALARPLSAARDAGIFIDPWAIAGVKRREIVNASVLAGLWRRTTGGIISIQFLNAFLDRLRTRSNAALLPSLDELHSGYVVRTEDTPMGDTSDRVDVTIEGISFVIGIEVKIDAGFQPYQLERYQASIARRAAPLRKNATVILLSTRPNVHTSVVQATWSDVASAARQVTRKTSPEHSVTQHLVERFGVHVSRF